MEPSDDLHPRYIQRLLTGGASDCFWARRMAADGRKQPVEVSDYLATAITSCFRVTQVFQQSAVD